MVGLGVGYIVSLISKLLIKQLFIEDRLSMNDT